MVKNTPVDAEDAKDAGLIPGSGRSPEGENGNPLQYSCLENPMGRGAWWATVVGSQRVGHDYACTHTSFSELFLLCLLFSLLQGETHTPSRSHTHPHNLTRGLSHGLSTVLPNMHTLSFTHSHTPLLLCALQEC